MHRLQQKAVLMTLEQEFKQMQESKNLQLLKIFSKCKNLQLPQASVDNQSRIKDELKLLKDTYVNFEEECKNHWLSICFQFLDIAKKITTIYQLKLEKYQLKSHELQETVENLNKQNLILKNLVFIHSKMENQSKNQLKSEVQRQTKKQSKIKNEVKFQSEECNKLELVHKLIEKKIKINEILEANEQNFERQMKSTEWIGRIEKIKDFEQASKSIKQYEYLEQTSKITQLFEEEELNCSSSSINNPKDIFFYENLQNQDSISSVSKNINSQDSFHSNIIDSNHYSERKIQFKNISEQMPASLKSMQNTRQMLKDIQLNKEKLGRSEENKRHGDYLEGSKLKEFESSGFKRKECLKTSFSVSKDRQSMGKENNSFCPQIGSSSKCTSSQIGKILHSTNNRLDELRKNMYLNKKQSESSLR